MGIVVVLIYVFAVRRKTVGSEKGADRIDADNSESAQEPLLKTTASLNRSRSKGDDEDNPLPENLGSMFRMAGLSVSKEASAWRRRNVP